MPPEQGDQERREIVGRLENKYKEAEAKLLQAEQDAAIARVEKSNLNEALIRAYQPPLSNDVCLTCWIDHGDMVTLKNVPEQPVVAMRDRFVCSKCGREEIRKS